MSSAMRSRWASITIITTMTTIMAIDHGHAHGHGHHGHSHAPADFGRAFAIGAALNIGFVAIEVGFGLWSNSGRPAGRRRPQPVGRPGAVGRLGASVLAKAKPTARFSYGLRSSSMLAALFNAASILWSPAGWPGRRSAGWPTRPPPTARG